MEFRNDDLSASSSQKEKAPIGVRADTDGPFLIIKMKWRKIWTSAVFFVGLVSAA